MILKQTSELKSMNLLDVTWIHFLRWFCICWWTIVTLLLQLALFVWLTTSITINGFQHFAGTLSFPMYLHQLESRYWYESYTKCAHIMSTELLNESSVFKFCCMNHIWEAHVYCHYSWQWMLLDHVFFWLVNDILLCKLGHWLCTNISYFYQNSFRPIFVTYVTS